MVQYEQCEIHKHEFVQVLKCFDKQKPIEEYDTIIVIIPGNPGLVEFYEHLATHLHEDTQLPVVAISHTGHLTHKSSKHKRWRPASYQQQISDKLKYIEMNFLENRTKTLNLILIGHSIGCDVIIKLLPMFDEHKLNVNIKKSILLFPTIERMSITPNGKILTPLVNFFLWFILLFAYAIVLLPDEFIKYLAKIKYNNVNDTKENVIRGIHSLSSTHACIQSALVMAKDEMNIVKEVDMKLIEKYFHNLIIYYGKNDRWCPVDYYHDIVRRLNDMNGNLDLDNNIILDVHDLEHAFVLSSKQTQTLGQLACQWIKSSLE